MIPNCEFLRLQDPCQLVCHVSYTSPAEPRDTFLLISLILASWAARPNRWCNRRMSACYWKGTCGHGLIQSHENTDALFQRSLKVNAQAFKRQVCCLQKCFKKLWNCLPKWLCRFPLPPATNESSYCSTSLLVFGVVSILDFSLSDKCAMISHCYFSL